jgi:hypothetical protein
MNLMVRSQTYHLLLLIAIGLLMINQSSFAQKILVFEITPEPEQPTTEMEWGDDGMDGFGVERRDRRWNSSMIGRDRNLPLSGRLDLRESNLKHLPFKYKGHKRYSYLNLSGNPINALRFGKLGSAGADTLMLNECGMSKCNRDCLPWYTRHLEVSQNQLKTIPSDIANLPKLRLLKMDHNQIKDIRISFPSNLEYLDLGHNQISKVFNGSFKSCSTNLEVLILDDNALKKLPVAIRKCEALKRLDMSNNELSKFNCSPRHLPSLEKLDLRGNPISPVMVEQLQRTWKGVELLIDEPSIAEEIE